MNDNGKLKPILAALFLAALAAYSRYHGGSMPAPTTPPSIPTPIPQDKPAEVDHPKWQPPESPAQSDSRDTRPHSNPRADGPAPRHSDSDSPAQHPTVSDNSPRRDLDQDEKRHGHTLQRHIGRTDEQLLERLNAERDISSASTWLEKNVAERTIGLALEKNKAKIDAWIHQGRNRQNLAFDYYGDGKTQIGRSIHRGDTKSVPCYNAKIVLKPDGDSFYVLTSYPEGR